LLKRKLKVMRIKAKIQAPSKANRLRRVTKHAFTKTKTAYYWSVYFDRMCICNYYMDSNYKMHHKVTYDYILND
jgi:hypothetical protein